MVGTLQLDERLKSKVIPRIFGGLGNQLFCYAAARRLALIHDAELVIDDISGFVRDLAYKRKYQLRHFMIPCRTATATERMEPFSNVRRYLTRRLNQRLPFLDRSHIQQEGMDFDSRLLQVKPRRTLYLEGYWQSEGYFKDVAETIREDLRIVPPVDDVNLRTAAQISTKPSVAVHMRFFDSPTDSEANNAPTGYYSRALAEMEVLVPDAHYYVFSDQPNVASTRVQMPAGRVTYISHNLGEDNTYADLWLMTRCRHFIIANSTFSWWGAWLAQHRDKHVIAPGFEKRHGKMWWGFDGLLPDDWIKL